TAAMAEVPAAAALTVTVGGIEEGKPIAEKFAYCVPDGKGQSKDAGGNMSPAISWSGAPAGTKSYAIIVQDPDVPASFESANQPGNFTGVQAEDAMAKHILAKGEVTGTYSNKK